MQSVLLACLPPLRSYVIWADQVYIAGNLGNLPAGRASAPPQPPAPVYRVSRYPREQLCV